ncbi:MAG: 30S ribosomal protein S16 [Sciscionella sp.]|nr:30S ribosomal protein S16 [Sciscionella sp.]
MAVKIRLARFGKIRQPYYRIVVADARTRRDGKAIETIGKYHPKDDPSYIEVDSDRAQYWLGVGAQPTDPVRKILEITGDWQKFKGLPGAEGTLKTKPAAPSKEELFARALAEAGGDATTEATTPKKKAGKSDDAKSDGAKSNKSDKADGKSKADAKSKAKDSKATADKPADDKSDKPADAKADDKADEQASADAGKQEKDTQA